MMAKPGWFSRRFQTSEQHNAARRDSKGDRKAYADERVGKGTGSDLGLKVRVKSGELSPEDAMFVLVEGAEDRQQAMESRTYKWLSSPNAKKRYKQGLKIKNKKT